MNLIVIRFVDVETNSVLGYVRLMVPRDSDLNSPAIRPFDLFGSEVDVLMELNPDGKVKMFVVYLWLFV